MVNMKMYFSIATLLASLPAVSALCPLGHEIPAGAEGESHSSWVLRLRRRLAEANGNATSPTPDVPLEDVPPPPEPTPEYLEALGALDIEAVQTDIKAAMTDSQDWWPADYGNYGPLFVRLAWHCSGTFRNTDGRGGCAGGRMRFDPEQSWEDNTNLDKARRLLWPIKEKYGIGLSWGDLFVMAGTTAIEAMGGPTLGVCVGRVDEEDGAWSVGLDRCHGENGDCQKPMGATTEELIYVNPEGPMGQPIPDKSALQVRDTFDRMGMDDREAVALIGGGHTFGKAHGACAEDHAAGLSPAQTLLRGLDPNTEAWQGKCGTGKGADAVTSGLEGPWTANPVQWDNSYFTNLQMYEWAVETGPGSKHQWHSADEPLGLGAQGGTERIMMLTADVALLQDPEGKYQDIVKEFAENEEALEEAFAAAWHKLTTSAFGNEENARCTGEPPFVREAPDEPAADNAVDEATDKTADNATDEATNEDAKATDETTDKDAVANDETSAGPYALLGIALHVLAVQTILFYSL